MNRRLLLLLPALLLLAGCRDGAREAPLDTPTAGTIAIAADESFRPLVQAEVDVFTGLYTRAHIDAAWMPEDEAIQALLDGQVRLAVVSRPLAEAEAAVFAAQKITPRTLKIAEDGVALIVHRSNPDSLLTMAALRDVFAGRARRWADLGGRGSDRAITIVFDNNRSSNLNFILRRFGVEGLDSLNVFAARSNAEVLDYVRTHEDALGVIGANWISDSDDPAQQRFVQSVSVVGIADTAHPSEEDYYQPYQAYLWTKDYPLTREVLILSREARAGLGTGFMSHVASERGQRIVLKAGLLPSTMPVRLVGIKDSL